MFQKQRFFSIPGTLDKKQKIIVGVAILGFAIGIISIVLGLATGCIKNRCVPITFGIFLTPVWILLFISGGFIGGLAVTANGDLQGFCDGKVSSDKSLNRFTEIFSTYASDVDSKLDKFSTKWMCTSQCPCNSTSVAPWLDLDEIKLNAFGRTKKTTDLNDSDGTVLLKATASTGNATADFYPATFEDCFFEWQRDWIEAGEKAGITPENWVEAAEADFESMNKVVGSFDLVEFVEKSYNCSGFCKPGLFFMSLPLSAG